MILNKLSKFIAFFSFFSFISFPLNIINTAFANELKTNGINKIELSQNDQNLKSEYLLGPGDELYIKFLGLQIFDGKYSVNPEGYIYLPEIEEFYVEGKTVKELNDELLTQFKEFLINPKINIIISKYRIVKVFIKGEVKKPGLYMFSNTPNNSASLSVRPSKSDFLEDPGVSTFISPRIFNVLKESEGITNFANLSEIYVIRKNSKSQGGGLIKAKVNLLKLIKDGDQSQNIRVMDGDTIIVTKSDVFLKEQINAFNSSNLSPDQINVYISGNVKRPGKIKIKQGSNLIQAISLAGGEEFFTGKVSHLRINDYGKATKMTFKYRPNSIINGKNNPTLMEGDIIMVKKSVIGKSAEMLKEISNPILTGYGLYNIFSK